MDTKKPDWRAGSGIRAFAVIISSIILASCVGASLVSYPKDFNWEGDQETTTVMQSLARSMLVLDNTVQGVSLLHLQQHKVITELEKMEFQARLLDSGPSTRHLALDTERESFLSTIAAAKLQVQANPPNFYIAGKLTGECNACHRKSKSFTAVSP